MLNHTNENITTALTDWCIVVSDYRPLLAIKKSGVVFIATVFNNSPATYFRKIAHKPQHGRPHIGANGVSWPSLAKMDEKLKSENMQKEQFAMFMLYFESNHGRQV